MTGDFLRSYNLRHSLLGQLVAVVLLLQPVANIAQADLAARNPFLAQILASLCAPGSVAGDERSNSQSGFCCTVSGQCASASCCTGFTPGVVFAISEQIDAQIWISNQIGALDYRARHHWPASTGPPVS